MCCEPVYCINCYCILTYQSIHCLLWFQWPLECHQLKDTSLQQLWAHWCHMPSPPSFEEEISGQHYLQKSGTPVSVQKKFIWRSKLMIFCYNTSKFNKIFFLMRGNLKTHANIITPIIFPGTEKPTDSFRCKGNHTKIWNINPRIILKGKV